MKVRSGVVSVILVNFRGVDDTITAIRGLHALDWPEDRLEVIVVDNASGDDSLARLAEVADLATIVVSNENLGFAGGCNLGVSRASGEYVAFLNNDARPDEHWIRAAVSTFEAGPEIGAVASKVLDWEGERVDFVDAAITWYGMGYKPHAGEVDRHSWDDERDVLFGTGAAMFVRAAVYRELGGFDESYFMFYEDVDLGWRINLAGYRFHYQPASLAFHRHHASMSKFGDFRELYLLERNALYTLYKNMDDAGLQRVLSGALMLAVRRAVGRGEIDSTQLDIRRPGGDAERGLTLDKSSAAGLFAIDQFVENLPGLTASRAAVQAMRRRSDRHLASLFGEIDQPAYPIPSYLAGYDKITAALNVLAQPERRRILVITGDPVGQRMAGPAIRAWNIASLLADEHEVRLVSMKSASPLDDRVDVGVVSHQRPSTMVPYEKWADVIVVQGNAVALFPALAKTKKILVVDVYDPLHLEQLEQGRHLGVKDWDKQIGDATETLNQQLELGDFFLCASDRQRHFWLGQLAALGRINAYTYSRDSELDSLIAIAPFGISEKPPVKTRDALRGVVPGIAADDKVIVWGGGIYDWFDPETLIRAVADVAGRHPDVRLFFMGVKHPNPDVPEMQAVGRARIIADRLGVGGVNVFFNESWVDYADRQNYLLDADLGVSTHFAHVETTFSFRTRILDYLWAGIPIVTTDGDSFADLVSAQALGTVVPERDVAALADAIESYLYDPERAKAARINVGRVRESFYWSRTLAPLVEFCRSPLSAADKHPDNEKEKRSRRPSRDAVVQPVRRTGVIHDLQRTAYYLREGGPGAVVERLRARSQRRRESV